MIQIRGFEQACPGVSRRVKQRKTLEITFQLLDYLADMVDSAFRARGSANFARLGNLELIQSSQLTRRLCQTRGCDLDEAFRAAGANPIGTAIRCFFLVRERKNRSTVPISRKMIIPALRISSGVFGFTRLFSCFTVLRKRFNSRAAIDQPANVH